MFKNSILFNLAWFGCVLLGDIFALAVLVWAFFHFFATRTVKSELTVVALVTSIGLFVDSTLMTFDVLIFTDETYPIPFWLAMIWLAFAMTLNGYLRVLQHSVLLQCFVGAIFPPLSYFAGQSLGAVSFGYSTLETIPILSVLWGILLPLFFYLNKIISGVFRHENNQHCL
jgi:hypothetical protein